MDADILVVGGGFCGTLSVVHLLRRAKAGCRIVWVEREAFARGAAYGTSRMEHLLNVPAGKMGAFSDKIGDFADWLKAEGLEYGPKCFVPRMVFARYLDARLAEAKAEGERRGVLLHQVQDEVRMLVPEGAGVRWQGDKAGGFVRAVVLATGNAPPRALPVEGDGSSVVQRLWAAEGVWRERASGLGAESVVAIVGSGLTMVDALLTLDQAGFAGKVVAVSRHAMLPGAHREYGSVVGPEWASARTALGLLAGARREVRRVGEWRGVVDGLRPQMVRIWRELPEREKARFAKRLLTYWNVHRHRMAGEVAAIAARWMEQGRLELVAARVERISGAADHAVIVGRRHGVAYQLRADMVLNATGPDLDIRKGEPGLLRGLMEAGMLVPGPLGWGVRARPDLSAEGGLAGRLFPLGTMLTGERLESTAVPELRGQAAEVAGAVLGVL